MRITPRGLYGQMILLVSSILLITGVTSGWLTARQQSEMLAESMREQSAVIVRNIGESCARFLIMQDYAELESLLVKAAGLPDIRWLQVCEPDGTVVADVEGGRGVKPHANQGLSSIVPPTSIVETIGVEGTELVIWRPIEAGDLLGWIRASYSLSSIRRVQSETLKNNLLLAFFWVMLSIVLLLAMLRPLVRAICGLTEFARNLDSHKGAKTAISFGATEIEELRTSLNYASNRLQASEQDLIREQETLMEQYSTLHGILESTDALIFSADRQYRYTSFNSAHATFMQSTCGVKIEQGKSFLDYLGEAELREEAKQNLDRALSGESHMAISSIKNDGSRCSWEVFHTPIISRDGLVIGVAVYSQDITERKRVEEELARYRGHLEELVQERTVELEEARNKARQYLDIAGVILVAIDGKARVTLINQKGCEVLQSTTEEIIGKEWFKTFIPEQVRLEAVQIFRQLMAGELDSVKYYENLVLTQNGEERLIAWHNVLLKDAEGNIIGTLSSGEDITEKKRSQEKIIRLNQDLQKRAAALQVANKELDAFAYSVSHDLRAPLRHIDGFIEMLKKNSGSALDDRGHHYMNIISVASEKMGLLIDDLLSFSRMGRQAISVKPVDLMTLVREVIQELEPDTAGRNIEWLIGDLPSVYGDAPMLRIVLGNLISNGLKYTRHRQQAQIEIGWLFDQEPETVIYVRDNGAGFDMAYVDKLFGVFQRLHSADEFEGTGIGLANVRRIVARHGGRTWAEGKIDQGATFYFSLPRIQCNGSPEVTVHQHPTFVRSGPFT